MGRYSAFGHDIGGEHPARGMTQFDIFAANDNLQAIGQQGECFGGLHQFAAKGETVIR